MGIERWNSNMQRHHTVRFGPGSDEVTAFDGLTDNVIPLFAHGGGTFTPGGSRVAALVAAASGPAEPHELRGESEIRAAFRDAMLERPRPIHRHPRWGRLAIAASSMAGLVAGTAGLSAAAVLPPEANHVVAQVLSHVGIDVSPQTSLATPPTPAAVPDQSPVLRITHKTTVRQRAERASVERAALPSRDPTHRATGVSGTARCRFVVTAADIPAASSHGLPLCASPAPTHGVSGPAVSAAPGNGGGSGKGSGTGTGPGTHHGGNQGGGKGHGCGTGPGTGNGALEGSNKDPNRDPDKHRHCGNGAGSGTDTGTGAGSGAGTEPGPPAGARETTTGTGTITGADGSVPTITGASSGTITGAGTTTGTDGSAPTSTSVSSGTSTGSSTSGTPSGTATGTGDGAGTPISSTTGIAVPAVATTGTGASTAATTTTGTSTATAPVTGLGTSTAVQQDSGGSPDANNAGTPLSDGTE